MHIVAVIFESAGTILGALMAALLVSMSLWWVFRRIGHPTWGPLLTLLLAPLAFALPGSAFVDMTIVFAILFAIPLLFRGGVLHTAGAGTR